MCGARDVHIAEWIKAGPMPPAQGRPMPRGELYEAAYELLKACEGLPVPGYMSEQLRRLREAWASGI